MKARDDAATRVDKDRAAVQSALANANYYRDQLADTQVRSPNLRRGGKQEPRVGEWVNPGTVIVTIDDLATIESIGVVPQALTSI
jgi:multidrug efflux pump subunit AcrA (membrane-fusion protein)